MASVFLSYDREDSERARPIALALEKAGHSVFWDLHIRGGAQFSKVIEEALKAADAVVVLWSRQSIESAWVRDEAAAGRDTGRLVPVTIDGTQPPLGFRQFQTIDLSKWKGRGNPVGLRTLLADVAAVGPGPKESPTKTVVPPRRLPALRWNWRISTAVFVLLAIVAGLAFWRPWATVQIPTLMVRSAAQDPASGALARDLMVKLGTLQSVQSASVQLISEADAKSVKPDLVLEVAPTSGDSAGANLLIKRRANGAILWSQDFEKDTGNLADFKQQITYTAARVVGCAGEGVDPRRGRIDDETLKLYINSCARFAEITVTGPDAVVASLRQVVKKAPEFSVAWEKLLLAELALVDTAREAGNDLGPLETRLRADIASARKFEPQMPEAILAQLAFVPPEDVATRMQIADRAKEADPTDPAVLHKRSIELQRVGRMREGIDDAQRALELDPLSPDAHGLYFGSLLYAGNIDGAQQELQAVERLWPSSSTARDLEGRFNLRNGDPRKALPEAQRLGLGGMVKMLEARIDPAKIRPYIDWLLSRRDYESGRLGVMIQGMAQFHYEDELYRTLFSWPNPDDIARMQDLWFRPWLHEFRRDPRFIRIMARTQLLKYWRTTGHWPDFCFEPDLPYDCRKEAARLGA